MTCVQYDYCHHMTQVYKMVVWRKKERTNVVRLGLKKLFPRTFGYMLVAHHHICFLHDQSIDSRTTKYNIYIPWRESLHETVHLRKEVGVTSTPMICIAHLASVYFLVNISRNIGSTVRQTNNNFFKNFLSSFQWNIITVLQKMNLMSILIYIWIYEWSR
jgi:hypothetical protein